MQPPPVVDDIRSAIERLKNPEQRLVDEFFWFWSEKFGDGHADAALQALERGDGRTAQEIWWSKRKHPQDGAVATHNLAVLFHMLALDFERQSLTSELEAEQREKLGEYWRAALYRWEKAVTDDQLWERLTSRIRQLNEPSLTTGFGRRFRSSLPFALNKVNAELAVEYSNAGKTELAIRQVEIFRSWPANVASRQRALDVVLKGPRQRLNEQISAARESAQRDGKQAIQIARDLIEQTERHRRILELFYDKHEKVRSEASDEVFSLCNQLQVTYHKATGDNKTSLDFLTGILPHVVSAELKQQIEENIATLKNNIKHARLYGTCDQSRQHRHLALSMVSDLRSMERPTRMRRTDRIWRHTTSLRSTSRSSRSVDIE